MAVINRVGIKQPDDSYVYHEVGAKATNVLMANNKTVEQSMESLIEQLKDKLDKAGGEVSGALTLKGGAPYIGYNKYIAFPQGGQFTSNETISGILKVVLPVFWDNTLIKFKISIANYKEQSSVDYIVSGYMSTSTSSWEQCTAVAVGASKGELSNLPVSFGYNANMRCVVSIGTTETSWSFASITVSDITVHKPYSSIDLNRWSNNWEVRLNVNNDLTVQHVVNNPNIVTSFEGDTQDNIATALTEAKKYVDDKLEGLFEGLPEQLDTLKEITAEINDNQSAIDTIVSAMQDKLSTTTFNAHANNTDVHVSISEKEKWDAKQDAITVDDTLSTESMNSVQNRVVTAALNQKVDVIEGKGLSSNDFTDAYKQKVDRIADDATKYVHPDSGVTPGTYTKVTVDPQGHVTEGSNMPLGIVDGGTGANTPEGALASFGLTANADELNVLTGVQVDVNNLNHLSGSTGNIQAQLDSKASKDLATADSAGLMSPAEKKKLQGISAGANLYYHPEYESASALGFYKVGIDTLGHVFNKQAITKEDITGLGIPESDTNTTYTLTKSGSTITLTGSDGSTTSVVDADNNTTYSQATSNTLGLVKIGYSTTGKNYAVQLDTSGQMYVNVPWVDTDTTYTTASSEVAGLMSKEDKTKLDGITASADEVSFTPVLTSGTKIGTITINGADTDIYCQPDTDTTYSAGSGISLAGTTFSNSGVRSVTTGATNGTISVNTGGTSAEVAVKGLGSAAYLTADSIATGSTVVQRTAGGYINATYFNQSSEAETPTTSSYVLYCDSDGYFRKSSVTNMKTILGIEELKKSVSDGKTAVANAITEKGVNTATDATFATMAENILSITSGGSANTSDATFVATDLLAGKTAYGKDGKVTGAMTNYSGSSVQWCDYNNISIEAFPFDTDHALVTLVNTAGEAGYYDNTSTITSYIANLNPSNIKSGVTIGRKDASVGIKGTFTSDATAAASEILTGKIAYVKGNKVTGTMANNGAVSQSLNAGGSYTIPAGYHNGSGKVTANSLASQTSGTATAAQILSGKTAWVGGSQLTGTMTNQGAVSQTLAINGSYTIPAGYHNGSGKVTQSITTKAAATYTPGTSNQTIAAGQYLSGAQTIKGDSNLVAANIVSGKTIFGVAGTASSASAAVAISTFSGSVVGTNVTFTWSLPTDSSRSGIKIMYKTGSAPTSASDGTAVWDSGSYSGTTTTTTTYDFKATGTYYVTIFSYTYVNNVRKYTTGKSITVSCTKVIGYKKFTSSGTFTVPTDVTKVDIFLVGGGYPGGTATVTRGSSSYETVFSGGAGGQGGQYLTTTGISVTPGQSITVTVAGSNGGESKFGSYSSTSGTKGGAGGNASKATYENVYQYDWTDYNVEAGTAGANGQYAFGNQSWSASYDSSIRYCAGGGGGGARYISYSTAASPTAGGTTGGGKGGEYTAAGSAASANTGSGGGGGGCYGASTGLTSTSNKKYTGGNGGSGCVIIRWGY